MFVRVRPRQQDIQKAVFGGILGAVVDLGNFLLTGQLDGHVGQIADDRVHFPADITHFGELGRLHLDERRVGETCQAPGDFRLAHPGGADHEDVLRSNLAAQGLTHLRAPPTIAKRDGHGALGVILADDVLVQFLGDFPGCHRHWGSPRAWSASKSEFMADPQVER